MPSPFGVNASGIDWMQLQFTIEMVLLIVSTPHEAVTMQRTLYVPVAENKWVGVKEVDVLFAPLEGSPKFQLALVAVAPVVIENGILFSRQLPFATIIPLQHWPILTVLQIVVTGNPGS
jgi:hypothetical protein